MGEQNEGTKIVGIVVSILLFLVVMAAIVGLVMWGTNKFNSTQSTMQEQVTGVENAVYTAYDETEVSGSDVLAACKTYKNSSMNIYVSTKAQNGSFYDFNTGTADALGTYEAFGYNGANCTTSLQFSADDGHFIDNVLVTGPSANASYQHLTSKGNPAYVNQNGKFWSSLVYDSETGEVAGVLFRQTK